MRFWCKTGAAKKLFGCILIVLFIWWISKKCVQIQEVYNLYAWHPPKVVWDFVADLNHMKITNPGLKNFEITSDGGIHPEWHYTARLHEQRDQFGDISISADYTIKPFGEDYMIISAYDMCKLFMCAHIKSTMTFKKHEGDKHYKTNLTEVLDIELPLVLSWFIDSHKIIGYHKSKLANIVSYLTDHMHI